MIIKSRPSHSVGAFKGGCLQFQLVWANLEILIKF